MDYIIPNGGWERNGASAMDGQTRTITAPDPSVVPYPRYAYHNPNMGNYRRAEDSPHTRGLRLGI